MPAIDAADEFAADAFALADVAACLRLRLCYARCARRLLIDFAAAFALLR